MAASETVTEQRRRMAEGLVDPKLRARVEAGKCIALTRSSAFMALCQREAQDGRLYCASH